MKPACIWTVQKVERFQKLQYYIQLVLQYTIYHVTYMYYIKYVLYTNSVHTLLAHVLKLSHRSHTFMLLQLFQYCNSAMSHNLTGTCLVILPVFQDQFAYLYSFGYLRTRLVYNIHTFSYYLLCSRQQYAGYASLTSYN